MKLFKRKESFIWWQLLIAVLLPLAVGFVGSFATETSIASWYQQLQQPAVAPPNWLFGPVWTVLYILMGIASYMIWQLRHKHKHAKKALVVYAFQLGLNLAWSFAFFGLQSLLLGLLDIILLLILLVATVHCFYHVDKKAAYLLLPYVAWVAFATYLNAALVVLN